MKEQDIKAIIAGNVSRLMQDQGLDQVKLAKLSGVSQKTVSNIVNARSACYVTHLQEIAAAMRVPSWILAHHGAVHALGRAEDLTDLDRQVALYISRRTG